MSPVRSDDAGREAGEAHWDTVGASYGEAWRTPAQADLSDRELGFVERHLRATRAARVVDVGVGVGRVLRMITSSVDPAAEVFGVDTSTVMLDAARDALQGSAGAGVVFVQGDVGHQKLPVAGPVDFISAIRVLKYTPSWEASVGHLLDALAPEGIVVFTMPNPRSVNSLWRPPFHYGRATASEIRSGVARLGATVLEMKTFTRIPDLAYEKAKSARAARAITGAEAVLAKGLGDIALGRELFVAIRPIAGLRLAGGD